MNIPDETLMAAYYAIEDPYVEDAGLMVIARAAVEAAAKHITAQTRSDIAHDVAAGHLGETAEEIAETLWSAAG